LLNGEVKIDRLRLARLRRGPQWKTADLEASSRKRHTRPCRSLRSKVSAAALLPGAVRPAFGLLGARQRGLNGADAGSLK